jgi:eukaryotic-like serine/threonine-protein kinase
VGHPKLEVRLIPPLGGSERKLAEIEVRQDYIPSPYLAWTPDARFLIATDSPGERMPDALFVISVETGEKKPLTSPQPPLFGDSAPAVSPDGRSMVFRRTAAANAGELLWLALGEGGAATGEPRRLAPAALNASYPAWMPDGDEILFSARSSLWRLSVRGQSAPARLPFVGEDGFMPTVSRPQPGRPGRLVYERSSSDQNIWRVETSGPGTTALTLPVAAISSTRLDSNAQFSPDGRRVALASSRSGDTEIWLADPDGGNTAQLTSLGAPQTGTPRWSPDGQTIAFDSNLEGQYEIYAISASGGKPRRLTSHPANDHVPSFSRDGKWIYFSSSRGGDNQIWKMPASGGEAIQVTHNGGYVAFESPDGSQLYYTQNPGFPPSALWRLPVSGGQPVKVLEGVVQRAFAVLGKGIYYASLEAPSRLEAKLLYFDFATGKSTTVAALGRRIFLGLTATADGRTILYTKIDSSVNDLMLVENFR